jgi:hypothetical protein
MQILFLPFVGSTIYVSEILELRNNFMKFKGYYHEKEEKFPLERVMCHNDHYYHLRINSKKQYEMDTSGGWYDEDVGADICLFPSYTVELNFTILRKDPSKAEMDLILVDIMEDEKLLKDREDEEWRQRHEASRSDQHPVSAESESKSD